MLAVSIPACRSVIAQVWRESVRGDVLPAQARAVLGGGGGVPGDELADCGSGQRGAGAGGEQWPVRCGREFADPGGQELDGVLLQRDDGMFASFAEALELAVRAYLDAVDAQAGQLTHP